MSRTIQQIRDQLLLTSIFGRRLGLDSQEFLVGALDNRVVTQQATTTTTGTNINPHGFTGISSSTNTTWQISAPVEGIGKQLAATSTSTGTMAVQAPAGVTFLTTAGSSFNQMVFTAVGQAVELFGVSTSVYAAIGAGSCAFSTF